MAIVSNIIRNEDFREALDHYMRDKSNQDLWNFFNIQKHKIAPDFVSYRVISHWEKLGLVKGARDNELGWRTYSIADIAWLTIIKQLRDFNVGLTNIRNGKVTVVSFNSCKYVIMEMYLALCLFKRVPVEVLFFADNTIEIAAYHEIEESKRQAGCLKAHISLNLNLILQSCILNLDLKPVYGQYVDLNDQHITILELLKENNLAELNIKIKDQKPFAADSVKKYNNIEEFHKDKSGSDFEETIFKKHKGKVQSAIKTTKTKL